jgi:DNA-binding transcriptional regulator YiaG
MSKAKLTPEQVEKIREMAKTVKQKDLAKYYGVSHQTISAIVNNRLYKTGKKK